MSGADAWETGASARRKKPSARMEAFSFIPEVRIDYAESSLQLGPRSTGRIPRATASAVTFAMPCTVMVRVTTGTEYAAPMRIGPIGHTASEDPTMATSTPAAVSKCAPRPEAAKTT